MAQFLFLCINLYRPFTNLPFHCSAIYFDSKVYTSISLMLMTPSFSSFPRFSMAPCAALPLCRPQTTPCFTACALFTPWVCNSAAVFTAVCGKLLELNLGLMAPTCQARRSRNTNWERLLRIMHMGLRGCI